jgi:hypothetical protein
MIFFIIIGFIIIYIIGNRFSGYTNSEIEDNLKPLDELLPKMSRFANLDPETYNKFMREINEFKKFDDLDVSSRHLRTAIDEFASMSGALPSGDSPYHEEIAMLASELGITGEQILMNISEKTKKHFTPRLLNALID